MTGSLAVYALQLGCVGTGLALAWRRPEHRPLAALMALGLAVDVALELALPFAVRVALGTCYPWAAWAVARAVLSAEPVEARTGGRIVEMDTSGPAHRARDLILHPSARLAADRVPARKLLHAPILLAFTLYVVAILASGVRGPTLARCYAAAQLVVAAGCGRAVWRWRKDEGRRGGGTSTPSKMMLGGSLGAGDPQGRAPAPYASRPLSATIACALVVAFVEMANPWAYLALPSWTSGRSVYAFGFVVVLVVQAAALTRERA